MKRVACYVRVSTQEQKLHGQSVDSQITALEGYCRDNKYECIEIYNDAGISARKSYKKRPALLQLMNDCKAGKIDLIIFTRLDRWFRNIADYYEVQKVLDDTKVPWRAIWEDYETETSAGVFKVNIMLSIAQAEADRTSEKIKSVMDYKRAKGEYVGSGIAPHGYIRKDKTVVIDENEQEAMRAFFDEYLSSFNIGNAITTAKAHGVTMSRECARRSLVHEIYAGKCQGVEIEPYITWEQHELIMKSFDERRTRRTPTKGYTSVFSGLCVCGICGKKMTAKPKYYTKKYGYKENKTYKTYTCYGTAQGHSVSVFEHKLEAYMLKEIESELENYRLDAIQVSDTDDSAKQLKALESQLERVGIRYELGDIETDEFLQKRNALKQEIQMLKIKANDIELPSLPQNWLEIYSSLDVEHKRAFWSKTIDHIVINRNQITIIL